MIEAPTLEQLYDRLLIAERQHRDDDEISFADFLSVKADYDRALIVAARARQGEY